MPTPSESDLLALKGFAGGLVNRVDEHETPLDALRAGLNVDITNAGKLKRRRGYVLRAEGEWHSLWSDESIGYAVAVKDGDLVRFDAAATPSPVTLRASVGSAEVSCAAMAGRVYWSNGTLSGMVRADRTPAPWAVESPIHPPAAGAIAAGGMAAGEYLIAAVFRDGDGREGGTGSCAQVELTEGQGINLAAIPQPEDDGVTEILIYVSDANGDVLHLAQTLPVGTSTATIGVGLRGRQLETQWMQPLPPGHLVAAGGGRLYVMVGNVMHWAEPMRHGLANPTGNYVRIGTKDAAPLVTMCVVVGEGEQTAGVFVAAGKLTYYMAGATPATWTKQLAFPHGAVLGTGTRVRAGLFGAEYQGNAAFWVADHGVYCLGLPSGIVQPLTEGRYVTPIADSGRVVMRRMAGLDQLVTVLRGTASNPLAFADSASAEVNDYGVSTDS